ncbi:hypothetical protein FACS189449_06930 [Alphaproteobacteria bacterium]|nr:hypothetical protein FACS189449_06930 [Alphaproteobacteria bacterium]
MFIPWDFGIINAIKKELGAAIFPPSPPRELRKTPYLVFELKKIMQGKNLMSRVEFVITIVDNENVSSESIGIMKSIGKIISQELTLHQENGIIGSARIKIDSLESRKNHLILNMVAILKLKAIYEDGENDD